MRRVLKMAAAMAAVGVASLAHAQDNLPPGPGRDTLVAVCSSCHAPDVVAGKQMSRVEWEKVVRVMADRGADGTDAQLAEIVNYLVANYSDGPKPPTQPAPATPK